MIKTEGVTYLGPPWSGVESIFEAWGINVIETSFGLETLDFKDTSSFTVAFFESPLVRFCNAYIAAMSVLELEPHPDRFHDWLRDDWVPYYYEKKLPKSQAWLDLFRSVDWFEPNLLSKYIGFKEKFPIDAVLVGSPYEMWPTTRESIIEMMKNKDIENPEEKVPQNLVSFLNTDDQHFSSDPDSFKFWHYLNREDLELFHLFAIDRNKGECFHGQSWRGVFSKGADDVNLFNGKPITKEDSHYERYIVEPNIEEYEIFKQHSFFDFLEKEEKSTIVDWGSGDAQLFKALTILGKNKNNFFKCMEQSHFVSARREKISEKNPNFEFYESKDFLDYEDTECDMFFAKGALMFHHQDIDPESLIDKIATTTKNLAVFINIPVTESDTFYSDFIHKCGQSKVMSDLSDSERYKDFIEKLHKKEANPLLEFQVNRYCFFNEKTLKEKFSQAGYSIVFEQSFNDFYENKNQKGQENFIKAKSLPELLPYIREYIDSDCINTSDTEIVENKIIQRKVKMMNLVFKKND